MPFGRPKFEYRLIGDDLVTDLDGLINRGTSFVLLGPQGCGKRYVMELLERRWEEKRRTFFSVSFGTSEEVPASLFFGTQSITDERKVAGMLSRACGLGDVEGTLTGWDLALRHRWEEEQIPLVMLATNVDGLSKPLGRQFLALLRGLVQDRVVIAAVTGESNLVDLVHGPTSEFNCSDQFVVHAHDPKHFDIMLSLWMDISRMVWPQDEAAKAASFAKLYEMTGGDMALLRLVLLCINERRLHHGKPPGTSPFVLGEAEIPFDLANTFLVPVGGVVPFRRAVRCVEADERCWPQLRHMINGLSCYAPDDVPTTLELAGLARRDGERRLLWASSYAHTFCKQFFTPTRLGDYYAATGKLKEAFESYSQETHRPVSRPLNDDDQLWFGRVVEAVVGEFARVASSRNEKNVERRLIYLLKTTALHLFGFDNAIVSRAHGDQWVLDTEEGGKPDLPQSLRDMLPLSPDTHLSDDQHPWWIVTRKPDVQDQKCPQADQLILLCAGDDKETSKVRRELIKRWLESYRNAREHVMLVKYLARREMIRANVLEVTENLMSKLGSEAWRTPDILTYVGERLVGPTLGIERLMFFLHSKRGDQDAVFQLVHDTTRITTGQGDVVPVSQATPLKDVYKNGKEVVLSPGTVSGIPCQGNRPLFHHAGIFQMKDVGVVVVEASGKDTFSEDLKDSLKTAALRLASVIGLVRKFGLLGNSLNSMTSPTLIIDSEHRVRLMNKAAIEKLGLGPGENVKSGWLLKAMTLEQLGCKPEVIARLFASPLPQHGICYFDTLTPDMPGKWLADIHELLDWDGKPGGWFLHIRDRALILSSYELMRDIESAQGIEEAMIKLAEGFRHVRLAHDIRIRLFLKDPNEDILHGKYSLGSDEAEDEEFKTGGYVLNAEKDVQGWQALKLERPMVYRWRPSKPEGNSQTDKGLEYWSVQNTKWPEKFGKEPGYFWIDFPLIASGRAYGKLTLQFTEAEGNKLTPEVGAVLQGLSFVIGSLIERLEEDLKVKALVKEAAEHALAQTTHTLVAKLAGIASYIGLYRLCSEQKDTDTTDISDRFADYYTSLVTSLRRIKERMGPIKLNPANCDLADVIESTLNEMLGAQRWSWAQGTKPLLRGNWDKVHIGNVFVELAQNSLDFADPTRALHVTVDIQAGMDASRPNLFTLVFADNGMGVAPEHKKDIFDALVSHRENTGQTGHGVGLNYVKRVFDALGGTCRETGERGQGARLELTFPVPGSRPDDRTAL